MKRAFLTSWPRLGYRRLAWTVHVNFGLFFAFLENIWHVPKKKALIRKLDVLAFVNILFYYFPIMPTGLISVILKLLLLSKLANGTILLFLVNIRLRVSYQEDLCRKSYTERHFTLNLCYPTPTTINY